MATAKAVITSITLDLSSEEAQFLADIMSRIGGSIMNSRRKHADEIGAALRRIGILDGDNEDIESDRRAIYFKSR